MSNEEQTSEVEVVDENELIAVRREKLNEWRKTGNAYPNTFKRDTLAQNLLTEHENISDEDVANHQAIYTLGGRIMTRRLMGKASFFHIQDMSGKIQVYVREDELPAGLYEEFKKWDLGDIVGVKGRIFKTKTGELSLKATHVELVTKALRPLPDKYHGLHDQEMRARQRYVDLMVNPASRQVFTVRSKTVSSIRDFLTQHDYIEVETPMMQAIPGGASARPFKTHHNALDLELYLRIAPELYLKRLVVGGFERVFEINRNFRNEGISTRHNPEFTMLEFYAAYMDCNDQIIFTENLLRYVVKNIFGTYHFPYQEHHFNFEKPFQKLTVKEAILHYHPDIKGAELEDITSLQALAKKHKIAIEKDWGIGRLQIEIFEETTEQLLIEPTFITQYPTEISPLARRNNLDPTVTDRFELFIAGRELANGFSELNDPEDQAERFYAQVQAKDAGDDEAMHFDSDYVRALEYGMPPSAGVGIGIDRLVMLLTDSASIREVILFPLLRPEA